MTPGWLLSFYNGLWWVWRARRNTLWAVVGVEGRAQRVVGGKGPGKLGAFTLWAADNCKGMES
eukprot:353494-Chlamydomonas_euryale.AAC.2